MEPPTSKCSRLTFQSRSIQRAPAQVCQMFSPPSSARLCTLRLNQCHRPLTQNIGAFMVAPHLIRAKGGLRVTVKATTPWLSAIVRIVHFDSCFGRKRQCNCGWLYSDPCDNIIDVYFGASNFDEVGETAFKKQLWQCMVGQALLIKQNIETRRSKNEFGCIVWQFNEIWPTGGWGSIEVTMI